MQNLSIMLSVADTLDVREKVYLPIKKSMVPVGPLPAAMQSVNKKKKMRAEGAQTKI